MTAWAVSSADGGGRFALEPLAVSLGIHLHAPGSQERGMATLADQIGVTPRQAHRLRRSGLSDRQADHFAIRAGTHPGAVWPDWWSHTDSREELVA